MEGKNKMGEKIAYFYGERIGYNLQLINPYRVEYVSKVNGRTKSFGVERIGRAVKIVKELKEEGFQIVFGENSEGKGILLPTEVKSKLQEALSQ